MVAIVFYEDGTTAEGDITGVKLVVGGFFTEERAREVLEEEGLYEKHGEYDIVPFDHR